jgi:hypothetical protein
MGEKLVSSYHPDQALCEELTDAVHQKARAARHGLSGSPHRTA